MHTSEFDGILFVEGMPPNAKIIGHVEVKLGGIFSNSQLKNLDDVKRSLAKKVSEKKRQLPD